MPCRWPERGPPALPIWDPGVPSLGFTRPWWCPAGSPSRRAPLGEPGCGVGRRVCSGRGGGKRRERRRSASSTPTSLPDLFSFLLLQVLPIWQSQAVPVPVGSPARRLLSPLRPRLQPLPPPPPGAVWGGTVMHFVSPSQLPSHLPPNQLLAVEGLGPSLLRCLPASLSASSSSLPWVFF